MTQGRGIVITDNGLEVQLLDTEPRVNGGLEVSVELGGICGTDLHIIQGHLPVPRPVVLGHEGVGRVTGNPGDRRTDSLGASLSPGDLVGWVNSVPCGHCHFCLVEMQPTLCTGQRDVYGINLGSGEPASLRGSWADRIWLGPDAVTVRLPDDVDAASAIALGCAGPTAVHGLLDHAPIQPGDVVVVQGAGPVGIAAATLAALSGAADIIMIGGPEARLKTCRALGIGTTHVSLESTTAEERIALVQERSGRRAGADVVVECAGVPAAVAESLQLARPNGTVCVLGQYSDNGPAMINPHHITGRQLKVLGSRGFSARHYLRFIELLPALMKRFDLAKLVTPYDIADPAAAIDAVSTGQVLKAAFTPTPA